MKSGGLIYFIIILSAAGAANSDTATFDDLTLPGESFWNGSDCSGGFHSDGAYFNNNYDLFWENWDGFSYSNLTGRTTSGIAGQYNAITAAGQGGSQIYAAGFVGWMGPPTVTLDAAGVVKGLYVTNNNYAYYSMLDGDAYAKKFGGKNGSDPDWFMLSITGKDGRCHVTGTVDFYLADFRFVDNSRDYIVDTWQFVDLTSLGTIKSLEFSLSSSDVGAWGMNTPACFALDSLSWQRLSGGPYTEPGINGYIGDGRRDADVNPIFRNWATGIVSYKPAPGVDPQWTDANNALGKASGDNTLIVSLGDLNRSQIDSAVLPGEITLSFSEPIRNGKGYDFAVFENGLISAVSTAGGYVAGEMFAELGYVEVSSNGQNFVRFPCVSLTAGPVSRYGTIEISRVYNLAGKHPNGNGICTGTPFDLQEIADLPEVAAGLVDINDIRYVRIVDIPGSGDFYDQAMLHIDPDSCPVWSCYTKNHPIYDAWVTIGSGGFDLEAVGVLEEQQYAADINLDGLVDVADFVLFAGAWQSYFGHPNWLARCDLAEPKDNVVDIDDLAVFAAQWLKIENWRNR